MLEVLIFALYSIGILGISTRLILEVSSEPGYIKSENRR
jgi:hypothetical protein